ncbi:hypothetical protein FA15DRAFT_670961, partial [Coprinopsis marcescibilis]
RNELAQSCCIRLLRALTATPDGTVELKKRGRAHEEDERRRWNGKRGNSDEVIIRVPPWTLLGLDSVAERSSLDTAAKDLDRLADCSDLRSNKNTKYKYWQ